MTAQDLISGKYRLKVADYRLLDETGAFGEQRTELIRGDVIIMSPEHRPHMYLKSELGFRLREALRGIGSRLYAGIEGSVTLSDHDEPRPDIILTSEPRGPGAIPPSSVALIVEVADSSSATDLGPKARLYAARGVPEYWVAEIDSRTIHQMWAPGPDGYAHGRLVAFGTRIEAMTIEGLTVGTEELV